MPENDILRVFTMGDKGVNRVKTPLALEDDELVSAQNAATSKSGSGHTLGKRPGMADFANVVSTVLAVVNGGATLPPSPPTPVDEDDDSSTATPFGSEFTALLDLVYMRSRLFLSAATTSINDNTVTAVSWTSEDYDVGNMHDLVSNPERVTVPSNGDGLYLVIGQAKWATSASAKKRGLSLYKNNAIQAAQDVAADDDGDGMTIQAVALLNLVAGDYVSMKVEQDTGGALDLLGGSVDETSLTVMRIVQTVDTPLPRCHAYKTSSQSLTASVAAAVTYDAEAFTDTYSMHDNVVNNTRITVPSGHDGLYFVSVQTRLSAVDSTFCVVELKKNGTQTLLRHSDEVNDSNFTIAGAFEMVAGDYFEVYVTVTASGLSLTGSASSTVALSHNSMLVARIG